MVKQLQKQINLTQAEKVLIALFRVANGSTERVAYEDLVLQAWRDFPEAFSLRNYPEYPDSSDIHKRIYQTLKSKGLAVPLGNKVFRLTDEGVVKAQEIIALLEGQNSTKVVQQERLSRAEDSFLKHAYRSRAFKTWQNGNKDVLIEYDARLFFKFSTSTSLSERRRRVNFAESTITKAIDIGISDVADLKGLIDYLKSKFGNLLEEV